MFQDIECRVVDAVVSRRDKSLELGSQPHLKLPVLFDHHSNPSSLQAVIFKDLDVDFSGLSLSVAAFLSGVLSLCTVLF